MAEIDGLEAKDAPEDVKQPERPKLLLRLSLSKPSAQNSVPTPAEAFA